MLRQPARTTVAPSWPSHCRSASPLPLRQPAGPWRALVFSLPLSPAPTFTQKSRTFGCRGPITSRDSDAPTHQRTNCGFNRRASTSHLVKPIDPHRCSARNAGQHEGGFVTGADIDIGFPQSVALVLCLLPSHNTHPNRAPSVVFLSWGSAMQWSATTRSVCDSHQEGAGRHRKLQHTRAVVRGMPRFVGLLRVGMSALAESFFSKHCESIPDPKTESPQRTTIELVSRRACV